MNGLLVWSGFTPLLTREQISDYSTPVKGLTLYAALLRQDKWSEVAWKQRGASLNSCPKGTNNYFLTSSYDSDECAARPGAYAKTFLFQPVSKYGNMTEILLADKGMRVSHSAMKSNSSEKSLTETWQKQLLLNCGLHISHTHTQRTCWLVPYFVRLMFHRYSQSQLHQYKIVFSVNQGPCIEQFDCSPPQCCYAIAKPFITFLLSFHWINIAIIIIYIFMLLTINIFLLMKFFTGCPVNCTLCLKDEFLG